MADDAAFYALRAEPFEKGYLDRSEQGFKALRKLLDDCLRDCLLESLDAGCDFASDLNDDSGGIDDRLEGPRLEAWLELRRALQESPACPWVARFLDAADVRGGLVAPDALQALVAGLRETELLPSLGAELAADDQPNCLPELDAFLSRAATAGAWFLWRAR